MNPLVIPAKAGIQSLSWKKARAPLDSRFRGNDGGVGRAAEAA
jgi:hypothetical protein